MGDLVDLDPDTTTSPTGQHGHGKGGGRVDETKSDGVEVDPVRAPFLGDELDTDENVGDGEGGEDAGGDDGALGDGTAIGQDLAD